MARLEINPRYRDWLARLGYQAPGDFLDLQGVVCSGHPDRHVLRLTLGHGPAAVQVFMKREHRVRWRDRAANALAGFGFASRSAREFATLDALARAGLRAPDALAAGEDNHGRAFLIVRELLGFRDLRHFLVELAPASARKRHCFARRLAGKLCRMHRKGFLHGDLYAKHILVQQTKGRRRFAIRVLDWQRAAKKAAVSLEQCWRDLAALDATVADDLASPRDRLHFLNAYLRCWRRATPNGRRISLGEAADAVRRGAARLLLRRRIREMREPPLATGEQNLVWLDGEALLMTREFHAETGGQVPQCLRAHAELANRSSSLLQCVPVRLPNARWAQLVFRGTSRPWHWLWSWVSRKPLVAPELESMKVLFRLQRYGVAIPRLLAAGQRQVKPWHIESFLLTEALQSAPSLIAFLENAGAAERDEAMRRAVLILRKMHQACCYLADDCHGGPADLFVVQAPGAVALATVQGIRQSPHQHPARAQRDLAALARALQPYCSRTALLRALLIYMDRNRLTPGGKLFAGQVLRRLPRQRETGRVAA
jgi:tRNA A-37 threonylcarbamoyl transferase component Bud32